MAEPISDQTADFVPGPRTAQRFAAESGLSLRQVYRLLYDGRLQGRQLGKRWIIGAQESARWLK